MHELSVCQGLIGQLERLAAEHGASRFSRVVLRIGPLAGIEAPLLREAFPIAGTGTPAEGAELVIEQADVTVHCDRCGNESAVPMNRLVCPGCGNWQTRLTGGDELLLASVELVRPETPTGEVHV